MHPQADHRPTCHLICMVAPEPQSHMIPAMYFPLHNRHQLAFKQEHAHFRLLGTSVSGQEHTMTPLDSTVMAPIASTSITTHDERRDRENHDSDDISSEAEEYSVFPKSTITYLTYLLGCVMLLSTLTATIYFPLIPMLATNFSVSIQAINLTVTVYAICQAISPGVFASLADAFGRRPVLLVLIGVYTAASLGLALNKSSYGVLMALRALQSIGGSATVPAISAIGPLIGGAVAQGTGGFEWVFMALLIIAAMLFVVTGLTLPETSRNLIGNGTKPAHGIWRTWWSCPHMKPIDPHTREKPDSREGPASSLHWKTLSIFASLRIMLYPDAGPQSCGQLQRRIQSTIPCRQQLVLSSTRYTTTTSCRSDALCSPSSVASPRAGWSRVSL